MAVSAALLSTPIYAQKVQYFRPYDQTGVNIFETSKKDTVGFDGLKVRVGGNFALQYQMIRHSNNPIPIDPTTTLVEISDGFNLATANLNFDVQLEDGVRLNLTSYLSSRHHEETWVKGGYIQFDKLAFLNSGLLNSVMDYVTLKIGHMEINYGDSHFRRTDNGNALYNPFVGNLIMDAFTTEIGGEVYGSYNGFLGMIAATGGEIKGDVTKPGERKPSFYGKLGYDNQISDALRVRLTGAFYTTESSNSNTLYGGDRAGSRYYMVLANVPDIDAPHTSGRWNPGFRDKVTSFVINPFIKLRGLELFGNFETAKGRSATETTERSVNQMAVDAVYRFLPREQLFIGARYNTANGELSTAVTDGTINRVQIGGGWFVTKNLLVKAEYVNQEYQNFPDASIYHDGEFHGAIVEAVIGF